MNKFVWGIFLAGCLAMFQTETKASLEEVEKKLSLLKGKLGALSDGLKGLSTPSKPDVLPHDEKTHIQSPKAHESAAIAIPTKFESCSVTANCLSCYENCVKKNLKKSSYLLISPPLQTEPHAGDFFTKFTESTYYLSLKNSPEQTKQTFDLTKFYATKVTLPVLFVAGYHGDENNLLTKDRTFWKSNVVDMLKERVSFKVIILDACVTSHFISDFKDLLADDGIIIANLTNAQATITATILGHLEYTPLVKSYFTDALNARSLLMAGLHIVGIYKKSENKLVYDKNLDDAKEIEKSWNLLGYSNKAEAIKDIAANKQQVTDQKIVLETVDHKKFMQTFEIIMNKTLEKMPESQLANGYFNLNDLTIAVGGTFIEQVEQSLDLSEKKIPAGTKETDFLTWLTKSIETEIRIAFAKAKQDGQQYLSIPLAIGIIYDVLRKIPGLSKERCKEVLTTNISILASDSLAVVEDVLAKKS